MKREKTTIHDIARKLNITASTVSRALKDHPRISTETKKAVLKVAEKLNYQPNHIAAALRNGRSNTIGIIVPSVDRSFFSSVVRGIEEVANKAKYNVMICQSYDNYEKEVQTINALLNAQVDGIIASFAKETDDFSHFLKVKEKGIPLVMFDRGNSDIEVSHVVVDDYLGSYKGVEHLIQQGCKRIAHFTSNKKISIYKDRLRGYREALEAYGLPFDQDLIVESNLQLEDGRESMEKLMRLPKLPDAVFSASAFGALGAMQVLKERNLRIPEDVALVAFTNEQFCDCTEPRITAIDQHSMRMGNAAAEIFLEEINHEDVKFIPQKIVLKPELIIRQSSLKKKQP
jgi:LacI family transcriptional regulator